MGAIKERLHEPRTQPGTVILDADAVLYSMDNDLTLNQLDAAHRELDARRARVTPGNGLVDPAPVAALRRAVDAQHRMEVRSYAERLKVAIRYQLGVRALKLEVRVATFDVDGFVQFTPLVTPPQPLTPVDQAIADAIALTPTPGTLPGTLLSRAEAEYTARTQRSSQQHSL